METAANWGATEIKQSAARGALFVAARQIVVQSANVVGTVLLTRSLTTAEFGLYAILLFLSQALTLLSGTALALQAVRAPVPLSKHSLRVLFTAQFLLSAAVSVALWVLAPDVAHAYHSGAATVGSLRIIAFGALISCFQTIPTALLERELCFGKLALAEIAQSLTFNLVAVGAAWEGFGIRGIAFGILSRIIVGSGAVNLLRPWPLGMAVDFESLRNEMGSGAAYFASGVVSAIKDAVNPVFLGLLLGAANVGLVSWANTVAAYCLIALMMLQRLYIPTFSRMSAHTNELGPFVIGTIKITNAIAAPAACLVLALIYPITANVFGGKWLAALPAFYLFWASNLIVPTVTPLISLLQAIDRGTVVFYASLMWMGLTWAFGVPAIMALGIAGAGLANFLVQCSNFFIIRIAKRQLGIRILPHVLPFWLVAGVCSLAIWLLDLYWPATTIQQTVGYLALGCLLYVATLAVTKRTDVKAALHLVRIGLGTAGTR